MTRIGYARTPPGQDPGPHVDRLTAAGCTQVFADQASGALADRPQLTAALATLGDGDQLVTCQLDHLALSLAQLVALVADLHQRDVTLGSLAEGIDTTNPAHRLVFAALADVERALTDERTRPGRDAANAKGVRRGGRPPALTPDKLNQARAMLASGDHTMDEIAAAIGVGRTTLYRHLRPESYR